MQIAIIQFPGSNCERETMLAVKRAGMEPVEFLWNMPAERLADFAGFIIVGGFSYEDRSRAGVIAALDPIVQVLKQQSELGKPILGICNGAQILVETGLVPGLLREQVGMVLTDNKRMQQNNVLGTGFYNAWVTLRVSDAFQFNAFTRLLTPKDILRIPIAHAEGRFVIPPALLLEMQSQGLNVFQYCDAKGAIIPEFPVNPNGSVDNIAAVSNKAGNVMAMMPHPERTPAGDVIFQSMRDYIQQGVPQRVAPLYYQPRPEQLVSYHAKGHELIVELIITDNQAISVENALNRAGIPVKIRRQNHWEIQCDSDLIFEKIKMSGVLYNDRKEKLLEKNPAGKSFLIRPLENIVAKQKQQMLNHHFNIDGIHALHHGILWQIEGKDQDVKRVLDSHILFNPYAHECYNYA